MSAARSAAGGATWRPRALAALAAMVALAAPPTTLSDDLPSPDAVALGQRIQPRALIDGFRDGVAREVLDGAMRRSADAAEEVQLRARARAALAPLLEEAFPPELLAGVAAQFLARRYTAEELRALRVREETPLGQKLRDFEAQAARLGTPDPAARTREREALAGRTFTGQDRKDLEAFAASPLGRKVAEVAPELERHFLDQLVQRWSEVRGELEPRMRRAAAAAIEGAGAGR